MESIFIKRRRGRPTLSQEEKDRRKQENQEERRLKRNHSRMLNYIATNLQNPNHTFLKSYTEEQKQEALA